MGIIFLDAVFKDALNVSRASICSQPTGESVLSNLTKADKDIVLNKTLAFIEIVNNRFSAIRGKRLAFSSYSMFENNLASKDLSDYIESVGRDLNEAFGSECKGIEIAAAADGTLFVWPEAVAIKEFDLIKELAREYGNVKGTEAMMQSSFW